MHKKVAALVLTCGLCVVAPAVAARPVPPAPAAAPAPPFRGNGNAVVFTEHDHGTFVAADRTNPCTGADDLTITFEGRSFVHVTETVIGATVVEARVLASESGTFATTIGGVAYTGRVSFSSRVIMNRQNSNFAVQEWVRATSSTGAVLRFHVLRVLVFSAANADEPVVAMTRVRAVDCPAAAAAGPATPSSQPAPRAQEKTQQSVTPRIRPHRIRR